jgi:fumarylacetoacetate (FAA) hydrolase family protein
MHRPARLSLEPALCLPADWRSASLVGRAWIPGPTPGPALVAIRADGVYDISAAAPTASELCNLPDPVGAAREARGARIGGVEELIANSAHDRAGPGVAHFLAPCDLQPIKAAGVTFVRSLLERVVEEQARGDFSRADEIRARISREIGADLARVRPGTPEAARLKETLVAMGLWSQYLEVGIGPDAEVFTKAAPLSAVGLGAEIGLHPASQWNNPEPELVLVINARGAIVGVTLGNDVNLRDFEGRSALLLGRSKDNNASCAIGPFIRLFDGTFTLDRARALEIALTVTGEDGFVLRGRSSIAEISRDLADLAGQTLNATHQYPDGVVLFTGTLFAPVEDRGAPGMGFTHKVGDVVTIAAPELGALVNRVTTSDRAPQWTFGAAALMRHLAKRGLLKE